MKTTGWIAGLGISKCSLIHNVSVIDILFYFRIKLKKRETKQKKFDLIQVLLHFQNIKRKLQTS